jgi:hypothetical protein
LQHQQLASGADRTLTNPMHAIEMHEVSDEFSRYWQAADKHLLASAQDGPLSWLRGLKSNGTKSYAKAQSHDRRTLRSGQTGFGGLGPYVDGSVLARVLFCNLSWSVQPYVRPVDAAHHKAAGHNALR